ncbi:MAG: DUF503 domain-containing protein [Pseudomonadota bacterium]
MGYTRAGMSLSPPPAAMSAPDLFICLLTVELVIPWAQSLKDKRSAVHGLKERLRVRFNASVAEVGHQDKWQRAVIAICMLGGDRHRLDAEIGRVRQLCAEARDIQIAAMRQEWL